MKLASIFTDNMVFQQGRPVRIFGSGRGEGEISIFGITKRFSSGEDSWLVEFEPQEYGGPYTLDASLDGERINLGNIYVGEVWLAGGQSNMELPLFRTEYGIEEAEHCENDMIRLFTVPRRVEKNRAKCGWHFLKSDGEDTPWSVCNAESALPFSAVGYYAAKELQKKLGCAVGMISCNWGGTSMETYTGREWYRKDPELRPALEKWESFENSLDMEKYLEECERVYKDWKEKCDGFICDEISEVREKGVRAEVGMPFALPEFPTGPMHQNSFGTLYDSMYSRIIPFSIKGILWYQGESNSRYGYLERYFAFMRCMRDSFRDAELPIYAIELASYCYWGNMKQDSDDRFVRGENVAFRRELQQRATEIAENNYLVTSMELGDIYDIHPIQKKQLTHRAVSKILRYTYGFDIAADQPVLKNASFENGNAILEFSNAEGLYCRDGREHVKIYLADESLVLKRADFIIEGNKLILSSPEVSSPILARYAFDNYYNGRHIYNAAGLPMAPFRTDNFD